MKITITEFRDMVAEAVRRTVAEAKGKPKEVAPRSEESILAQRDAQVRGLPGYAHGNVLDMSRPLGKRNRAKKQGAANMGNWTSESRGGRALGRSGARSTASLTGDEPGIPGQPGADRTSSMLMQVLQRNGIPFDKAQRIVSQLRTDDPGAVGLEAQSEAVRRLVRMIVREEIRVVR